MGFRASGLACPALDLPVSEERKRYLAEKGRNSGILRGLIAFDLMECAKTYEILSVLSSEKGAL
jgi:hypothetical protein